MSSRQQDFPSSSLTSSEEGTGKKCIARSARNLASFDAASAHVETLGGAVNLRSHSLNVGVETTLRDLARPRAVITEAGFLRTNVTDGSHRELLIVDSSLGVARAWTYGTGHEESASRFQATKEEYLKPIA
jgi:hypothetical protein